MNNMHHAPNLRINMKKRVYRDKCISKLATPVLSLDSSHFYFSPTLAPFLFIL